jgi:ABC-type Zn uptake system ZnuABC Zn-binding protein ZnuA
MKNMWIWATAGLIVLVALYLLIPLAERKAGRVAVDVSPSPTAKLKVAATIFPLADIVKNVGGDMVDVVTIMPPGASPHTFEPTPETVNAVSGARIIFRIGGGLDNWVDSVTGAMQGKPVVVEASGGIELRKFEDGSVDPHYWLSLKNGQLMAVNVGQELSKLDPKNAERYMANMIEYTRKLEAADADLRKMLAPVKGRSFATFHEAWFYFAKEYGLDVAEAFEPFPGKEPTPAYLKTFGDTVKAKGIKWIFSEPQFSSDAISQVAADLNVKLGVLDPEGGWAQDPSQRGYIQMMKRNAETILKAMNE